ncbi:hypothetical protein NK6_9671 [Bradyrhizobium diazoefficiens]|uniref:Uncharacterized protein n=1 Tax=Bradyrhizobium diazoefficiens TaxID=1355477 RepID=A0A0E4BWJ6_9BRAD|nr:hypothetical protein NK6_9671 [Bradyrhizobium diazoefficiens]
MRRDAVINRSNARQTPQRRWFIRALLQTENIRTKRGPSVIRANAESAWCGRRDSNPHNFRHWNLNPARLPVPPRPREFASRPAAMPRAAGLIACA